MSSSPDSSTNKLCDLVKITLPFCAPGFSYVKWASRKKKRAETQWAVFMKSSILLHTKPLEQRLAQHGSSIHAGLHDPLGWVKQAGFLLPCAHPALVCVHRLYHGSASTGHAPSTGAEKGRARWCLGEREPADRTSKPHTLYTSRVAILAVIHTLLRGSDTISMFRSPCRDSRENGGWIGRQVMHLMPGTDWKYN